MKWYDSEKGFGFLSKEEGGDVYVRAEALPSGVTNLKPGQKVEFGVVEGRKGEQALQVRLIDPPPSVAKAMRPKPEDMQVVIEDLIKLLDRIGEGYRHGRQPDNKSARQVATVLRGVADKLDV
ncbi:CspA family cold shock protein [Kribbella aluminosa]|uniref:CspA family cold shock protein n=1 Tax=Kribbella aluminosa TaxID=416017 RepID=A0ABS4UE43_9ACTN|nr:CspA family cold shock protein [Kribbella aluminosa]